MSPVSKSLPRARPGLKRVLSSGFGLASVLVSMIGLGIPRTPGEVATAVYLCLKRALCLGREKPGWIS